MKLWDRLREVECMRDNVQVHRYAQMLRPISVYYRRSRQRQRQVLSKVTQSENMGDIEQLGRDRVVKGRI